MSYELCGGVGNTQPAWVYLSSASAEGIWLIHPKNQEQKYKHIHKTVLWVMSCIYRAGICIRRAAAAGNRPIHPQGHRPGLLGDYMRPHQNTILTKLFGLLGELLTPYQNTVLTILLGLLGGYMRPHQKTYFDQITNNVDRHCWVLTYFVTKDAYNCCNEKPLV